MLGDRGLDLDAGLLRFFCMGQELKDELYVHSYSLIDEITIQCMQRKAQ